MRQKEYLKAINRSNRGAVSIFVAVVLLSLIGMASFAIDIGYIAVTKSELQNAADSAALAAVRRLAKYYEDNELLDLNEVKSAAKGVVGIGKNTAGGKTIGILDGDIEINKWDGSQFLASSVPPQPDAVRVTVRRDNQSNGPLNTLFARILGIDEIELSTYAIAALTNTNPPDTTALEPVGVSSEHFTFPPDPYYCGDEVDFTPCVAGISSSEDLSNVKIGDELQFLGRIDESADPFQSSGTITVVVFDQSEDMGLCGDERLHVVGFAEIEVDVISNSRSWKCSFYQGRGFGSDFPVKSTIPGLVR
jgi:hypothetical protein